MKFLKQVVKEIVFETKMFRSRKLLAIMKERKNVFLLSDLVFYVLVI